VADKFWRVAVAVAMTLTLAGGVSAHQKAPTQAAALGIKGRVHVIKVPVFFIFFIDKVAELTTKKGQKGVILWHNMCQDHTNVSTFIYTPMLSIYSNSFYHIPRVRREQRNNLEISCILIFVGFSWMCERNEAKW
jgi:hypothetical protein